MRGFIKYAERPHDKLQIYVGIGHLFDNFPVSNLEIRDEMSLVNFRSLVIGKW